MFKHLPLLKNGISFNIFTVVANFTYNIVAVSLSTWKHREIRLVARQPKNSRDHCCNYEAVEETQEAF